MQTDEFRSTNLAALLVSVVVPVYNGEKYIRCAIDSVLAQDYRPLEIIVVDDGSSDATLQVLADYGDRIRVFSQPNKGSAAARNLGTRVAEGAFIAFIDADDYWFPGKISAQMAALRETGCRMSFSQFLFWCADDKGIWPEPEQVLAEESGSRSMEAFAEPKWVYVDLLLDCLVWTSTVVVERDALLQIGGFDEDLRKGQDYDLWLRLSRELQMASLAQVTALYRTHGESITHAPNSRCFEYEIVSNAVKRWGVTGPDGRTPGKAVVVKRIRRAACNFASSHWKWGNPGTGLDLLDRLRREYGLGIEGMILYARIFLAKAGLSGLNNPRGSGS